MQAETNPMKLNQIAPKMCKYKHNVEINQIKIPKIHKNSKNSSNNNSNTMHTFSK